MADACAQQQNGRPIAQLCVLASGSRGNCSVLLHGTGELRTATLIDVGLSPTRTRKLLGEIGVSMDRVHSVLLTHLDRDHCNLSWGNMLPRHTKVHVHPRHLSRARKCGFKSRHLEILQDRAELPGDLHIRTKLLHHDELGVAVFRMEVGSATIGFATDVGRITNELIEHLREVDLLAIESNYCPHMQTASSRPEYLKQRIMGGAGHLSNQQCFEAVGEIRPRQHVVLLHLSQECNEPTIATRAHQGASYELTVTSQDAPTAWVDLHERALPEPKVVNRQSPRSLFDSVS